MRAGRKVYHGRTGTRLKSSTGSSFLGCWGNKRDFQMFQCLSCPPVTGSRQYLGYVLILFTDFWVQCEHLVLVHHCKRPGFNSHERFLWNKALFPQEDFSWRRMAGSYPGQGCLPSWGAGAVPPVFLQLQVCCCCRELHLSVPRGCPFCHGGVDGPGQGELQLQAEGKKQCKAWAVCCISWALQNAVLSPLRSALSRVALRIFSSHVLSACIMQWALGF